MAGNKNLHASRAGKTDEFYTQQQTIEDELQFYSDHFAGKSGGAWAISVGSRIWISKNATSR